MHAQLGLIGGAFSWISDLTDKLGDWAGNWWFLGVIFAIALLDSVIPIVPSETTVIVGGVAVATGDAPYPLIAVIAAGDDDTPFPGQPGFFAPVKATTGTPLPH